jgi:hypothetical protein
LSLRLRTSVEAIVAVTLVVAAAVVLAVFPAAAEAQTGTQAEDRSAPSVVVRPGDSLWSISEERLGPNATPQRVARGAQRIHALNRERIGADPDLIFAGQELSLPPALSERPTGASAARKSAPAADAGERDRTAEGTTGSKATGKAPRTAPDGAAAEGGNVPAPVAQRESQRESQRGAEPVNLPALPDEAAAPVPAARTLASNDSSPSPVASVLRTIRTEFTSAASWLADSFAGAHTDGRRLLGLGVLVLTLLVAALVAWKLPMRRTTRRDAERWGIPTGYYGARPDYRNAPIASRPGSPGDLGREEAGREETPVTLAPEQRGVPTGNGVTPVANGARNAAATTSATTSAIAPVVAARRERKAKPKAKHKAKPRNGLALGAHNPEVRRASLLAQVPTRARKPRPLRRAARPPLASAPEQKRRGEQR